MDLVAACRAFVSVAERGSFTAGAARLGIAQSVASRRVAALEQQLGGLLLDRRGRPTPTVLGQRVLATARHLVATADRLDLEAEDARALVWQLAVPRGWSVADLVALDLAGRDHDLAVHAVEGAPAERAELLATRAVQAALVCRPAEEATWRTPLGVATATPRGVVPLASLRRTRRDAGRARSRLWLLEEDDVPHVRDRLVAAAEAAGLAPTQVAAAPSPAAAVAAVLTSTDLLLASRHEAERHELAWAPVGGLELGRGYDLVAAVPDDAARLRDVVGPALGRALGAA
ncbi:LysR family transcriptional regulator [Nocardioides nanhaiensis]|uniref:LysR family transcriptional regulator n=1 Tax=Nocardioides nanhaiensis TaxID=1476871 RepID=A0ABP8WVN2_9ACTN